MAEAWLSGPVAGVDRVLMPAAHALIQARADLDAAARDATPDELWRAPGGAAPAGFHLRHLAGALDRLMTYARDEPLSERQQSALAVETSSSGESAAELIALAWGAIDAALEQIRRTPAERVFDARAVGRAQRPATVLGLIFHGAEHTTRHTGQLITTLKAVRGGA
jgi:hypothetical protein